MDIDPNSTTKSKKHKQFKTKANDSFKKPKTTAQIFQESKSDRRNRELQLRKNKINEFLLRKRGIIDSDGNTSAEINKNKSLSITNLTQLIDLTSYKIPPKICALVALNGEANLDSLLVSIEKIILDNIEQKNINLNHKYQLNQNIITYLIPGKLYKGKERITFIKTVRKVYSILDACKVADFVIFVSSCAKTDSSKWQLDPLKHAYCMDDFGYSILSMIKAQGMTDHLGLIQDMSILPRKRINEIKDLFMRIFTSESSPDKVFSFYNDNNNDYIMNQHDDDQIKAIIRKMCSLAPYTTNITLRKHRSYMMCEDIKQCKDNVKNAEVYGYIRGNTLIIGKYIHITGFGDFKVIDVDDADDPLPTKEPYIKKEDEDMKVEPKGNGVKDNIKIENDDDIESKQISTEKNNPEIIGAGNAIKKEENVQMEEEDNIDFDINLKDDDDISYESNESNAEEDEEKKKKISNKHKAKTSLQYRTKEEMEFQDEVDTPIDVSARERFKKYRGLASMKNGSWDPMGNLPKEYSSIFSFENIRNAFSQSVKLVHNNGIKKSGSYIKITITDFNISDLIHIRPEIPIVLSTLLEHERKLCVMHYKIETNMYQDEIIIQNLSKRVLESQCGFRRILIRPIFSSLISNNTTDKIKFQKYPDISSFYTASVYSQLTYPNSPVLLFIRKDKELSMVASGTTIESDARKIILKKIILTGYPVKIKKKNAVVRYMFFNPNDVNYFKPITLRTKSGLMGHIKESVGTHGYMKCYFNNFIKSNDTVCLELYKRVFPVWFKESWRYKIFNGNKEDYMKYFEEKSDEGNVLMKEDN